jgi:hypothetical protein
LLFNFLSSKFHSMADIYFIDVSFFY